MGSDEAFEERDKSVSTPVSNRVGVPELDRLLNEVRYGVLDNSPERVDKASDAIRTLFTSIGSPETHSEREPDGWRPIETAPKDGTHVVVMYEPWFRRTGVATVAHYFEGGWHLSVNRDGENSEYKSATHWMPLPTLGTPPAVVDTTPEATCRYCGHPKMSHVSDGCLGVPSTGERCGCGALFDTMQKDVPDTAQPSHVWRLVERTFGFGLSNGIAVLDFTAIASDTLYDSPNTRAQLEAALADTTREDVDAAREQTAHTNRAKQNP